MPSKSEILARALRAQLEASARRECELIETRIAWVLLAGDQVYRIWKSIRLELAHFGRLATRHRFCQEEVRLNRRLAPRFYLGVASIGGTPEAPTIDAGVPIEYAVRMRRFPDRSLLPKLLREGRFDNALLDDFARRLADFHGQAAVAEADSGLDAGRGGRAALDTLERLGARLGATRMQPLRDFVVERLSQHQSAWDERLQAGRLRECHGDLHLGNLALADGELVAFNSIVLDPSLRWIDAMSDVAFLAMDLQAHGRGDLAFRFLDRYLQLTGDYAGLPLLRFYEVKRAMMRAFAAGTPPADAAAPEVPDYIACATAIAAGQGAARLLITHGLSGSGTDAAALALVEAGAAIRLRYGVERKRLFRLGAGTAALGVAPDIYGAAAIARTFARLVRLARIALLAGYPVIVDAAFLHRADRDSFRALALELRVPFAILDCRASPALLRQRMSAGLEAGDDASDATLELLELQMATHEPLDPEEEAVAIPVDAESPLDAQALSARWLATGFNPA